MHCTASGQCHYETFWCPSPGHSGRKLSSFMEATAFRWCRWCCMHHIYIFIVIVDINEYMYIYIYIYIYSIRCIAYQNLWTIFDLQSVCFTEKARCGSICKGRAPVLRCCYDPRILMQKKQLSGEPYSARMMLWYLESQKWQHVELAWTHCKDA